jgi:hypothetical protein
MTETANIDVTIRHRTGREESFSSCKRAYETDDAESLIVEYRVSGGFTTEEFDAKDWRFTSICHTETY